MFTSAEVITYNLSTTEENSIIKTILYKKFNLFQKIN